jgi:hypothetical protein
MKSEVFPLENESEKLLNAITLMTIFSQTLFSKVSGLYSLGCPFGFL